MSYHIHQLEQEFHIKIFYRNPKKLTLTPEGKVLVKYAKRLVNISEAARRALVEAEQQLATSPSASHLPAAKRW